MSYSSLITIDKEFYAYEDAVFQNSWLYGPMLWTLLTRKYFPEDVDTFILSGRHIDKLNQLMNSTPTTFEQICWELSLQQIFDSKDKHIVANAIRECIKANAKIKNKFEDEQGILQAPHIVEYWENIAKCIEEIDENKMPHFVFKCNSIDDNVWRWFGEDGEESLKDYMEDGFPEFVVIEGDKVVGWVNHSDYDYEA